MTNAKTTKKALFASSISMLLCVSMLIGTTFAWFTDTVTNKGNKIQAGKLDVALLMHDGSNYVDISDSTSPIFGTGSIAQNNNAETLWEPGKTQVAYLAIENKGNLDLKYTVGLNVQNVSKDLYEVMEYAIVPDAQYNDGTVTSWTSGNSVVEGTQSVSGDVSLAVGATHHFALVIHMDEEAGDEYQGGEVNFDLTVLAAQINSESDSFGTSYDMYAEYGDGEQGDDIAVGTASDLKTALTNLSNGQSVTLTQDIDLSGETWDVSSPWQGSDTEVVFDGAGHTIKGLTTDGLQGGLFGRYTTNGNITIKNLKLENVNLTGTDVDGESAGGALIGWNESHGGTLTIDNVHVTGVNIKGFKYIGGLIGYTNTNGLEVNITNCSVNGTALTSTFNENDNYKGHIGGLVGYFGFGTVTNCKVSNLAVKRAGTTEQLAASDNRAGALFGTVTGNCTVASATVSNVTVDGVAASINNVFGPNASKLSASDANITIN